MYILSANFQLLRGRDVTSELLVTVSDNTPVETRIAPHGLVDSSAIEIVPDDGTKSWGAWKESFRKL